MDNSKKWHISDWSILGWVETILKIIAFIFAGMIIFPAIQFGNIQIPSLGLFLIIQILLSLGLFVAIFDRLKEKEIIAMVFIIVNNLAHWGIVYSLFTQVNHSLYLLLFFVFMLVGDLVKIIFIKTTNFTVRDLPKSALYGLTIFYIIGYSIQIFILLL
ncbi:MAG: hypothetical protein CL609_01580 [Anaerolineaceae bacterium]|nr:hypothetical protein [Anaerolineaceae bacterium]